MFGRLEIVGKNEGGGQNLKMTFIDWNLQPKNMEIYVAHHFITHIQLCKRLKPTLESQKIVANTQTLIKLLFCL